MRLTPQNAKATHAAGVTTFVFGGLAIFVVGALGTVLAMIRVIDFAWEPAALMIIGALVTGIGRMIPRRRGNPE